MNNDIQFVEIDAQVLQNQLIKQFENAIGETFYPGDERRLFLQQMVQLIVALKNDINETGKENLLRYATGSTLEELGAFYNASRLLPQKAKTTIKVTLSAAQPQNIIIPPGTRVTPDGVLYFATTKPFNINSGETQVEVEVEATAGGKQYNDFAPGQIKTIVDPVPFVASIENINISFGGTDIETDESFRQRIRIAPASFSTAGPDDAYIFWAKTADINIEDVSVFSPAPGTVKMAVLMKDGELPTQIILDKVAAAVTPKNRRPLTDNVEITVPTVVNYNVSLTYYISQERQTEESSIRDAIEGAGGAVDLYNRWQSSKLKRAINPDYLRNLMLAAGAYRIVVLYPQYSEIGIDQVANVNSILITYGGLT